MRKLSHLLNSLLESLLALLLLALVLLVTAETALWALWSVSHPAVAEVQSVLQIWFAFLGAAYGVRQGFHVAVELVAQRLPAAAALWLQRLALLLVAACGLLLLRYGVELALAVDNRLPATGWSASSQYLPSWVAGALIAFFALERAFVPQGAEGPAHPQERTSG